MTQLLSRSTTGLGLFFASLALAFVPPQAAQVGELPDREQQALGKLIAKWTGEKSSEKERDKARNDLTASLEKIGKKKGAKEESEAVSLALAMNADMGRALFYSGDFKTSLRGGKPIVEEISAPQLAENKISYTMSLPSNYRAGGPPLPLILCIPDVRDRKAVPSAEFLSEHFVDATIRDSAVIAVVPMPATVEDWNSKQIGDKFLGGVSMTMFTWGDIVGKVTIDADRVYLLGRGGEGVGAAMHVAARFPALFAGVIGVAGDSAENIDPTNFLNLPTYFISSGANATAFEAKVKEAGFNNCTLKPEGTIADAWAWMQQTTRVAIPMKVNLKPVDPAHDRAYWLRIPRTDGLTNVISAECDRASNTIKVSAAGVANVTVLFCGGLIDFTKPVQIDINGKVRTEKIVPTLEDFKRMINSSDNGRVFVASRVYDV